MSYSSLGIDIIVPVKHCNKEHLLAICMFQDGVDINCHGETINYTGSLVLFVGDTPAANLVAGFKEGVGGAEQKCRTCYTNAMQMKSLVSVPLRF